MRTRGQIPPPCCKPFLEGVAFQTVDGSNDLLKRASSVLVLFLVYESQCDMLPLLHSGSICLDSSLFCPKFVFSSLEPQFVERSSTRELSIHSFKLCLFLHRVKNNRQTRNVINVRECRLSLLLRVLN